MVGVYEWFPLIGEFPEHQRVGDSIFEREFYRRVWIPFCERMRRIGVATSILGNVDENKTFKLCSGPKPIGWLLDNDAWHVVAAGHIVEIGTHIQELLHTHKEPLVLVDYSVSLDACTKTVYVSVKLEKTTRVHE